MKRALLFYGFGATESMDDVDAFFRSVTRGRKIAPERLAEVREHYRIFHGTSPLVAAQRHVVGRLREAGVPVYPANQHSAPFLPDVVRRMVEDGVDDVTVFLPTPFSSVGQMASLVPFAESFSRWTVLEPYGSHPLFIEAQKEAISLLADGRDAILFSVHSLPLSMAQQRYEPEVRRSFHQIGEALGDAIPKYLAWQSASSTGAPWLAPSVEETLEMLSRDGRKDLLLVPLGFSLDNMEVAYDLDIAAAAFARNLGLRVTRVPTIGTTEMFLQMILEMGNFQRVEAS